MKTPAESTLLSWNRQILAEKATPATERKLVNYVRTMNETTGFTPSVLMGAYYMVCDKHPRPKGQ